MLDKFYFRLILLLKDLLKKFFFYLFSYILESTALSLITRMYDPDCGRVRETDRIY